MSLDMGTVIDLLVEAGAEIEPAPVPGNMRCPVHGDNEPSCYVWHDHFHCFVCNTGGGPVEFVAQILKGSRSQAKAWLEQGVGEELEWSALRTERVEREPIDLGEAFKFESQRGARSKDALSEAVRYCLETWPHLCDADGNGPLTRLYDWGVRISDYNLLIPHHDDQGRIVGVKTRCFAGGNKGTKRSIQGSTYPRLYRVEDRPDAMVAWLVEGESDTWTMTLEYPTAQVFGLPTGANTWRESYRDELMGYPEVIIALDNDDAGRTAGARITADLVEAGGHLDVEEVYPSTAKDWTDVALRVVRG